MILNIVLILVILGLTFICMLIFEYLERLLLWICMQTCCRKDKRLHHVIIKNMEAHKPRNSKTSLMFTLSISFLIFSASSFSLMSTLIVKLTESIIGADLHASNPDGYLNEVPIAEFLDTQMGQDDSPVIDYAFTTISTEDFVALARDEDVTDTIKGASGASLAVPTSIYAVPENFLNVALDEYLLPSDSMSVNGISELPSGQKNVVEMLYSHDNLYRYPTYPGDDQDAFDIGIQYNATYAERGATVMDVPMLLSEGLSGPIGLSAGDRVRWYSNNGPESSSSNTYMGTIRSMLTKFPGFTFSGLNTVIALNSAIISMPDYQQFMQDTYDAGEGRMENVADATSEYEFKENIPKKNLFVKFSSSITSAERDFISNGIRNYFLD